MSQARLKKSESTEPAAPVRRPKAARRTAPAELSSIAGAVMEKAKKSGLMNDKGSRITGRVSKALIEQAKRRTGIVENTKLIEYALASLALEDDFAAAFRSVEGKVDPAIKLGF